MISNYSISKVLLFLFVLLVTVAAEAKTIKVIPSVDGKQIGLTVPKGHARIAFKTNIKDLSIETTVGDAVCVSNTDSYQYYIDIDLAENRRLGLKPQREIVFRCSNAAENRLSTDELLPGQFYLYHITIDDFPVKTALLYSRGTTGINGFMASYGARYGAFFRMSFAHRNQGVNIADWDKDEDISDSRFVRYNHLSIILGTRIGVRSSPGPVYVYLGGGYGAYCRQWETNTGKEFGNYYYSDYLKGLELDLGISMILLDFFTVELGTASLFGAKGQTNTAFRFGVGLSF